MRKKEEKENFWAVMNEATGSFKLEGWEYLT